MISMPVSAAHSLANSLAITNMHATIIYIILLDPDERRPTTTLRSNDTLVDTPFQLISGFFHVNKVLSV